MTINYIFANKLTGQFYSKKWDDVLHIVKYHGTNVEYRYKSWEDYKNNIYDISTFIIEYRDSELFQYIDDQFFIKEIKKL